MRATLVRSVRTASPYARWSVVACLLLLAWLLLPGRPVGARQAVSTVSFVVAPALGAWRCRKAARRRDAWTPSWWLLSAGLLLWASGSALWGIEGLLSRSGQAPFPSPADAAWLLFPVLAVGGLVALPALPRRRTPALRLLLDGVAAAAALLVLARLGPLGTVFSRDLHGPARWVASAYPAMDVLAAAVVLVVLDRLRNGLRDPGTLIAVALATVCASDLTYALMSAHGSWAPGLPLDVGWTAGFLLIGYAAGLTPPGPRPPAGTQQHQLPVLPAALAMAALLASGRLSSGLDPILLSLVGVLALALSAREYLLTAENRALNTSLELRVAARTAELRETREVYRRRAYTDPLTGLANRDAFNEALADACAREDGLFVGVVLLDLDGFKQVNDGFGHETGDEVLVAVAERLRGCLRRADSEHLDVTRLGGDEFACLLRGLDSPEAADRVAERLLHSLRASVVIEGREFFLSASAGVAATQTPTGRPPGELLREADTAMYVAKDAGGGRFRTFDTLMHSTVVARVALEADLHRALADGDIHVEYQPIFDLHGSRVVGLEALARWNHAERGPVSPVDFIPVAERTGLILELERQVLEQVCIEMARWRRLVPDLKAGVNFSARHLREDGVVRSVLDCLARHDLPPQMLVAEVTESLFFADEDVVSAVLRSLHDAGVVLALDDFGTGYSSLSRLSQHPFQVLKVDRSFLAEVDASSAPPTILLATLAIARGMGLDVVAEGVETQAQLDFLRDQGCPFAQGFGLARPMPPRAVAELLESSHPVAVTV